MGEGTSGTGSCLGGELGTGTDSLIEIEESVATGGSTQASDGADSSVLSTIGRGTDSTDGSTSGSDKLVAID